MTQELEKVVFKAFSLLDNGNSPEYAKEKVPKGLSRLLIRDITLLISSWLRLLGSYGVDLLGGAVAI